MENLAAIAKDSKSWPFEIANSILQKIGNTTPEKGYVLFCTGYGPSGLPHIGTYCEVVRTRMVQVAFEALSNIPTKLLVISDDMDGLRKIPSNIPNPEKLEPYIQKPLTEVPDPFGENKSYGDFMNSRCKSFLDKFNFEYEFQSSTDLYKTGKYDKFLLKALEKYNGIMSIMLPTLGEDRQKTYSPFLPICPRTGKVLYVPIISQDLEKGTVIYIDEKTKKEVELPVTKGHCKLQWKPDFGMRWAALDVDFEMYGKDHLVNSKIYTKICRLLDGNGPIQFCYEMFLDEYGKKISKSKGNGVTIDEWLTYAPIESLAFYMYQSPRKAKKLYFDVIPKNVDEYLVFVSKFHESSDKDKLNNPAWHVHNGNVPSYNLYGINFSLLLNLACACNPENKDALWGFIKKYSEDATPKTSLFLDILASYAVKYYEDFIKPNKKYKEPTDKDITLLLQINEELNKLSLDFTPEDVQNIFYKIGKNSYYKKLKDFFQMIYEILLGRSQGPRLGSFVMLYGVDKTINLIISITSKNIGNK